MLARVLCVFVALTAASGLFTVEAAPSRSSAAADSEDPLIRFHPVSQEQYDRILKLTGVRQPGAFEVRTLQMDFKPLAQLRTSISNDFSTSWHRLLNFAGLETRTESDSDSDNGGSSNSGGSGNKDKEAMDGYPLCLVRSSDVQALLDNDHEKGRRYEQLSGVSFGGDLDSPVGEDDNSGRPVVNCVVVLKPKKKEPEPEYEDGDYEDGGEGPRPPPPHSWPGYPPQSYPSQGYPQPYYPMYPGYGGYPASPPEDPEDSKYKFSVQFGRNTESPVIMEKKEKPAKPQGKSELKATSRQAYSVGLPGSFPGLTTGVPGLPGIPGGSPIIGGYPGMGFPHGGFGHPPFMGQPGVATPIVIPPQMFGIPSLFPYGGYGYGGGYSYDHHDDHHDHHDHDDDDHDDHYHYHDHYHDDDHYGGHGHGYDHGHGHGHGGHGGHGGHHHGGGHYGGGYGGHYRSLNAGKTKKKSV